MIPKQIQDDYIDRGVFDFVKALNSIPDVYTMTTCEGHVWRNVPIWPAKDGWVHVNIPSEYADLREILESFVEKSPIMSVDVFEHSGQYFHHTFNANYESFDDESPNSWSKSRLEAYWNRADKRHLEHLKLWDQMARLTEDYIQSELGLYPNQLIYRE